MVGSVIAGDKLQRIPGKFITAVVIDRFESRKGKETGSLPDSHACYLESKASTKRV